MPQDYPVPPMPHQHQSPPGRVADLDPAPDHGEHSYRGSGKLTDRVAILTGGDSGIGRAVAIAFAREGADLVISYLDEHDDARETAHLVEQAGRKAVLMPGDIRSESHCQAVVARAMETFGKLDILVNNAATQRSHRSIDEITEDELQMIFQTNLFSQFYFAKAALPHMKSGGSIINTSSIAAKSGSPHRLAYAASKAGVADFTIGLAKMLGERNIRVNAVAPGPVWTPLITSTMLDDEIEALGKDLPLGRPGQPAEVAGAYVLLASDEGSFMTGAVIPVTGGSSMF